MRRAIVPTPATARRRRKLKESAAAPATRPCSSTESRSDCNDPPTPLLTWPAPLKRVFEMDIRLCPLCGGQLRVNRRRTAEQSAKQFAARIADITDPDLIGKILDHVDSRAPPRLPPTRAEAHQTPPDLFAERRKALGNRPAWAHLSRVSRNSLLRGRQRPHQA